jgi:hypothetical protein
LSRFRRVGCAPVGEKVDLDPPVQLAICCTIVGRTHLTAITALSFRWNEWKATDQERTVKAIQCAEGKLLMYEETVRKAVWLPPVLTGTTLPLICHLWFHGRGTMAIGLSLIGLIIVTSVLALAVGVPPNKLIGPARLRSSLGGRFLIVTADFSLPSPSIFSARCFGSCSKRPSFHSPVALGFPNA